MQVLPKKLRRLNMTLLLEVFKKIPVKILMLCVMAGGMPAHLFAPKGMYVFGRTKVQPRPSSTTEAVITGTYKKLKNNPAEGYGISFGVTNTLGRTVYVVPFAHIKRFTTDPWHWYKAPILVLEHGQTAQADLGTVPSLDDLTTVFGELRICATQKDAEDATFQLVGSSKSLDLDLLSVLNGKTVVLHSSQYGVEGERLTYEVTPSRWKEALPPLDFPVLNSTNEKIFVTSFFYGKEQDADDFVPWRFSKSGVYELEPGKGTVIKVEIIKDPYDWGNVRGFLGVFKENEAKKAENSTYELLIPRQKIALGPLASLGNKQVVITSQEYGSESVFNVSTKLAPIKGAAQPQAAA